MAEGRWQYLVRRSEPALQAARLRAAQTDGGDFLAWLALGVALLGILLGEFGGGYHAGFVVLNAELTRYLPDWFWATVTRFGDERVLLALSLLLARYRPEVFWALLLAALLGVLYSRGLKLWLNAARPPAVLGSDALHLVGEAYRRYSFPSGHTLTAFVFVGVLCRFLPSWRIRTVLLIAAALVGLSRVAVGVHWPQDVLAGAFGGLLAAWIGAGWSRRWSAGLRPRVHLVLLVLPVFAALHLFVDDGGYAVANWLVWPLAFATLTQAWKDYWPSGRRAG